MTRDENIRQQFHRVFDQVHAPEALTEAVMNNTTKTKKTVTRRRLAAAALALVLIFAGSNGVVYAATGNTWVAGMFSDVTNWTGAVVGTKYAAAEGEIAIAYEEGSLQLCISDPEALPFRELDELSPGEYQLLNTSGKAVLSSEGGGSAAIDEAGISAIALSFADLPAGEYTLILSSIYGASRADAPLLITGSWQCSIIID